LRILFAKSSAYIPDLYAGAQVATHHLCLRLLKSGHHTAIACLSANRIGISDARLVQADMESGYPVYRSPALKNAINVAVNKFQPDVLVLQEALMRTNMKINVGNLPLVVYIHALPPDSMHDKNKIIILPTDTISLIVNSEMVANFFRFYGFNSTIVRPIFGIDRFANHVERKGNAVLCMSIQKRKGTDVVIRLAESYPDIPFIFVESWSKDVNANETATLKARIRQLPNARLIQNTPDLSTVFAESRLLIMPSRSREAWGRTASEAQTFGIPVLGSNRGNLPNTIGPGGVVLDPDADIQLWMNEFNRIWKKEEYYEKLSTAARAHVKQIISESDLDLLRFESALHRAIIKARNNGANTSTEY
jgi:glycosyltransferase involved in cell wall biosynthesis